MPIIISLVEDQSETADMLEQVLASSGGFLVASRHRTAEEALQILPGVSPQVVLVDLQLPGINGADCIRQLKGLLPKVICLVITQFDDSDLLFAAIQAGADGYLLKRAKDSEIVDAIRVVLAGGGAMSPSICRKILDYFQSETPSPETAAALSQREVQLLQLARRGKRAKEISRALGLSYQTVRTHFRNIYRKLQVNSLQAAVTTTFGSAGHTVKAPGMSAQDLKAGTL
jgi:DNA-binding NarL/FixJ family response regulator